MVFVKRALKIPAQGADPSGGKYVTVDNHGGMGYKPASVADAFVVIQQLIASLLAVKAELVVAPGIVQMLAGATILKGQAVSLAARRVILADRATSIPCAGVALTSAAAGNPVRFMLGSGLLDNLDSLTPDKYVYLGNAGALLYAKPVGGFIQGLGYTISATELFVNVSAP